MTEYTKIRRRKMLLSLLATSLLASGLTGHQAKAAPAATTTPANSGPAITGFRGAQFGMTIAQVRNVIASDFKLPAAAVSLGENAIQHTEVLSATVPNLIPGGGTASVSYVFGYQSHKLMEINVLWSSAIDPATTPEMIYQNGESLQQYFAGEGFPPQRSAGNIATPNGILLFRTSDANDNAILLILSGTMAKDPKSPDKTALTPTALTLAYAANAQHPDVFQLSKGSF